MKVKSIYLLAAAALCAAVLSGCDDKNDGNGIPGMRRYVYDNQLESPVTLKCYYTGENSEGVMVAMSKSFAIAPGTKLTQSATGYRAGDDGYAGSDPKEQKVTIFAVNSDSVRVMFADGKEILQLPTAKNDQQLSIYKIDNYRMSRGDDMVRYDYDITPALYELAAQPAE